MANTTIEIKYGLAVNRPDSCAAIVTIEPKRHFLIMLATYSKRLVYRLTYSALNSISKD